MKNGRLILAALLAFCGVAGNANAGLVIDGPSSFPYAGVSGTYWGIQFTANRDALLTGFDYNHRPYIPINGEIHLIDVTGSPIDRLTLPYSAFQPSPIVESGLALTLLSGHTYELIASSSDQWGGADSVFVVPVDYSNPAYSNADITVTNSVADGANDPWSQKHYWYGFTKITTDGDRVGSTDVPAPEPSTWIVWSLLGIGLCVTARRGWVT